MDGDEFRAAALDCVGGAWPEAFGLDDRVVEVLDRGNHIAQRVCYQVEPDEYVSAWLLLPKDEDPGIGAGSAIGRNTEKRPAIALWHQHNNEYHIGKSEAAGFIGNPMHHTGLNLVREGYVVLCPDALGFEERRNENFDGGEYERFMFCRYLSQGKSLAWKNILDCRRALDYLCSRSEVDAARLGCYGHSLGATFSWLLGPWEPRLRCIAGNCCMPSYKAIFTKSLNHSFSNYIPSLCRFGDIPDWVSLIAPTPLHLNFGAGDPLNPIGNVREELPLIADSYAARDAADAFSWFIDESAGHALTAPMLARILDFFRRNI